MIARVQAAFQVEDQVRNPELLQGKRTVKADGVLFEQVLGLPVERSAFSSVGSRYVDMNNNELDRNLRMYSEAEMIMYGMNTIRMDDSAIADLSDLVDDLTGWYINDGSINAIIREEMPAYFEGQKTLDQIIPVLEDRVQTVINERR